MSLFPKTASRQEKEVTAHLEKLTSELTLSQNITWLDTLVKWIRAGEPPSDRLRVLVEALRKNPRLRPKVARSIRNILDETTSNRLFIETGLVQDRGFLSEFLTRLLERILPLPVHEKDLAQIFVRIFRKEGDANWIANVPEEIQSELIDILRATPRADLSGPLHAASATGRMNVSDDEIAAAASATKDPAGANDPFATLRNSVMEALAILGAHVLSIGMSQEIRERLPKQKMSESPFLLLSYRLQVLYVEELAGQKKTGDLLTPCQPDIDACRRTIAEIFGHLEQSGVSVSLVYHLELILSLLKRIESILGLLSHSNSKDRVFRFMGYLIKENSQNRTVRQLLRSNLHLLSRKIAERTGATGEHYITRTKDEYIDMVLSACGGGLVTVFTAYFKFGISALHLAPFFEGLFLSLNYAVSFILMQLFHFTLATKQPSMTAATLAGKLPASKRPEDLDPFLNEMACLSRSQLGAAMGNVGTVVPGAFLFDLVYRHFFGEGVVSVEKAEYVIHSLDPIRSPTIPLALLTGVLLWLGSIVAGWIENWFVYRQLPLAIATNRRLNALLGEERSQRISDWLLKNISGLGGNTALGFLLGFPQVFAAFFGIPIDVRHVTLSTGALTLAACVAIRAEMPAPPLLIACFGIICVLACNFIASFSLALFLAAKARDTRQRWTWFLLKSILFHFFRHPLRFFWPVNSSAEGQSSH